MKPTETLMAEHRVIERGLDVLLALARAETLDRTAAGDVVDFIRNYGDTYHHAKEEHQLFPAMEARGVPKHAGPIAVMLYEHDEGRSRVRAMAEALENGDDAAFKAPAEAFVMLLRDHIAKEDGILYPMADGIIDSEGEAELLAAFEKVEAEQGAGAAKLRERVMSLAESLGLPATSPSSGGGACGMGGGCDD